MMVTIEESIRSARKKADYHAAKASSTVPQITKPSFQVIQQEEKGKLFEEEEKEAEKNEEEAEEELEKVNEEVEENKVEVPKELQLETDKKKDFEDGERVAMKQVLYSKTAVEEFNGNEQQDVPTTSVSLLEPNQKPSVLYQLQSESSTESASESPSLTVSPTMEDGDTFSALEHKSKPTESSLQQSPLKHMLVSTVDREQRTREENNLNGHESNPPFGETDLSQKQHQEQSVEHEHNEQQQQQQQQRQPKAQVLQPIATSMPIPPNDLEVDVMHSFVIKM